VTAVGTETNMRDAEHFRKSYEASEIPWEIKKPDVNLIQTVTSTRIVPKASTEGRNA
jgi:hypothetical protein